MTSALMVAMVVASFVLGFARDLVIAWRFGGTWRADALFVCLVLPVFFENLLGIAVRDGIIGFLSSGRSPPPLSLRNEVSRLQLYVWSVAIVIAAAVCLGAELWLPLLAPGWSKSQVYACIPAFRIAAGLIFVQAVLYFQTAVLNVGGTFLMPMWRTILLNAGALLALFAFPSSLVAVVGGMLAGQALLLLMQQAELARSLDRPGSATASGTQQRLATYMVPLVAAAILQQSCVVGEKYFGSLLDEGSIAYLSFGFRIATIPLTVFSLSFLSVIYPALSLQARAPDLAGKGSLSYRGFAVCLMTLVPAATLFIAQPTLVVSVLLERGAFGGDQSRITASLLAIYAAGMPAMGIALLGGRILLAQGRGVAFLVGSVLLAVCTLLLNWLLYGDFGPEGLAAAISIGSWVQAVFSVLVVFAGGSSCAVFQLFARWSLAAVLGYLSLGAVPIGGSWMSLGAACAISLVVHLGVVALIGDVDWLRRDFWSFGLATEDDRGQEK